MSHTPFDIQELLDHCIGFLAGFPIDLCACALVSRAWVHASQSHIFALVILRGKTSNDRVLRLLEVWDTSPHLVRHTQRLIIELNAIDATHFLRISNVPFTHLSNLILSGRVLDSYTAVAIQRLLRLPTLRSVRLMCQFQKRGFVREIWAHASPSIEHLVLGGSFGEDTQQTHLAAPEPAQTSRAKLKSFHIFTPPGVTPWWCQNEGYCPFDVSDLKSFTCDASPSFAQIVRSRAFAPALPMIEILTFHGFDT
ncbi:hypothetical protein B0H11DRAFT_1282119 [Mycena galericulata]|nr:hypothetical protein B0H11DRAFT_1282119 [Mycena galericulata]